MQAKAVKSDDNSTHQSGRAQHQHALVLYKRQRLDLSRHTPVWAPGPIPKIRVAVVDDITVEEKLFAIHLAWCVPAKCSRSNAK